MFLEWVFGTLFHPAATFERARTQLRFGYWWILLCEFTLETVIALYSPVGREKFAHHMDLLVLLMLFQLFLLLDIQALFLMGAARLFGWKLTWTESLKYIGLAWSVELLESVVLFYPAVKGYDPVVFWTNVGFLVWHYLILMLGVRRLSGFPVWRAALLTAIATVPWQGYVIWVNWTAMHAM